jgi:HEAT repeat protein
MRLSTALFALSLALSVTAAPLATEVWMLPDAPQSRERERTSDREDALYDRGFDALDEHDWKRAATAFRSVADMKLTHADAALYWLGYSENKLGQRSEALATLLAFQKAYPKSRWVEDAKALEVEIRQSAGQQIAPERVADDDVKLMALNSILGTEPGRAIPIIEKILVSNNSDKVKERALFVLMQSGSPQAYEVVAKVAKGSRPELQKPAIRYLGIMGGAQSRKLLGDVYTSSSDVRVKKSVLKSYMLANDRTQLLTLAKAEQAPELRAEAVAQLGLLGAKNELSDLYTTESAVDVRKRIIQAMFIGGSSDKLFDIARSERVPELRVAAITNLGLMGGARTGAQLVTMYESDNSGDVRHAVVKALFLQGNARALIDLARKEKDPQLKKDLVQKISLISSREATDFLVDILKE